MDKNMVRVAMLDLEQDALRHAREHYKEFVAGAHISRSEAVSSDDQAHAHLASALADAFDHPQQEHTNKLEILKDIDFRPKEKIEQGAIVKLFGCFFVVSVSTTRFKCEGVEYMGISTEAPVYKAIAGKKSGDICHFKGRDLVIEGVW